MSQALTWSVGGKNPGDNAGNDTWLLLLRQARIWFADRVTRMIRSIAFRNRGKDAATRLDW